MEKIVHLIILASCFLLPMAALAQGMLYVSNLGQTSTGGVAIGSDSWIAQGFYTGTNSGGYILNSVQLLMNTASGSPSGFSVSLYNFNSSGAIDIPGSSLGGLAGSTDPSAAGIFTYTASDLELSPSTEYFVLLTAATPLSGGTYNWSKANSYDFISSGSWFLSNISFYSSDGSSWGYTRLSPVQLAVYATPIPEPSIFVLAGLCLATMGFWRCKS